MTRKWAECSEGNPEFLVFKSESRVLAKNPDDLPNFLGSPADPLFGSQRALVPGCLRVPKSDLGLGAQSDANMHRE